MASASRIEKNLSRKKLVAKFENKRKKLKDIIMAKTTSNEDRFAAQQKLNKLPRNSSKVRIRNRCAVTGRPRGYYRKFDVCRIILREEALKGELPGVKKASW